MCGLPLHRVFYWVKFYGGMAKEVLADMKLVDGFIENSQSFGELALRKATTADFVKNAASANPEYKVADKDADSDTTVIEFRGTMFRFAVRTRTIPHVGQLHATLRHLTVCAGHTCNPRMSRTFSH